MSLVSSVARLADLAQWQSTAFVKPGLWVQLPQSAFRSRSRRSATRCQIPRRQLICWCFSKLDLIRSRAVLDFEGQILPRSAKVPVPAPPGRGKNCDSTNSRARAAARAGSVDQATARYPCTPSGRDDCIPQPSARRCAWVRSLSGRKYSRCSLRFHRPRLPLLRTRCAFRFISNRRDFRAGQPGAL